MIMGLLTGKTAVITGAARGIGKAIALKFASEGANIAFTDLIIDENGKNTETEIAALGVKVKGYASNAANFEDTANVIKQIHEDFGSIDILVNNAGFGLKTKFIDTNYCDVKRLLYLHIMAVTKLTYFVLQGMKQRNKGTIINISSDGAFAVLPKNVVYSSSKLYIINFTEIEETIYKEIPNNYLITIMRRMMYRISEILCKRNNCKVIINGESIGQVASQTLTSMNAINKVVDIPVIRPVACFDKLEIINLANKIDTYNTSILPFEDCCTIFVPKHPVINPDIRKCEEYEKLIPYQDMIYNAIKTSQVIKINPHQKDKEYEDIL